MTDDKQKELENIQRHPNYLELKQLRLEGLRSFGLFIGSGLSQSAGLKGWAAALNSLLDNSRCKERLQSNIDLQIKDIIKWKRYTYAAYLIKHFIGADVFQECIEQEFDKPAILPDIMREALTNCCDSADIRLIVTTNFDRVLEESLYNSSQGITQWVAFTHDQCDRVRSEISKGSQVIFKIHGDIKDFDSIVLTQIDYQNLYYKRRDYTFLLAKLLDSYTFLFLGFSLDDPFFSTVLDTLSAYYGTLKHKHFALLPDTSFAESIAWADLRGVRVIPYKVKALGGHEPALLTVLRVIENTALELKVVNLTFNWRDTKNWRDSGAHPQVVEEDREKVLKANFSEQEPGNRSNCSIHRSLGNIVAGRTVRARVKFKCNTGKYGMVFIGDAGGRDPYDNSRHVKKQGNGDWQELSVEIKYTHDDICSVFLYGNRDDGKVGDFVLYKDLEITMIETV